MSNKWNAETAWALADTVGKSYAIVSALSDRVAAVEGITSSKVVALAVLDAFPRGVSQTEWGSYQAVTRQRASVVAKELEVEGLVRSAPEGRKTLVSLTAKGSRCVQKYKKLFGGEMGAMLDAFSTRDGEKLMRLLGKLIASMENSVDRRDASRL